MVRPKRNLLTKKLAKPKGLVPTKALVGERASYNMPITKSAKKALRQNKTRRIRNVRKIVAYKALVKDFRKLVAENKKDEAQKMLPKVYQALDKAAKSGVIKKNKASHLKSNTSHLLQSP